MLLPKLLFPGLVLSLTCGVYAQTGTSFCAVTPNTTGVPAILSGAFGSGVGSDLHLEVNNGVPNEIGYFLAGSEVTSGVVISDGLNCLVGTATAQMFRYNIGGTDWMSVGRFDGSGLLQNLVGTSNVGTGFDVPGMIPSGVPIPILSGDTWHFQLWYRDTGSGAGRSNFSSGLSVSFGYPTQAVSGMVLLPAGVFSMGSDAAAGSPYYGSTTSQPIHNVTISEDFWIGEHEVTQIEYLNLMGANPSNNLGPNLPVEQVSWVDARAYCTALTAQEDALGNIPVGYEYRLPTEAEWEYACRGGTTTEYHLGDALFCIQARMQHSFHNGSSCGVTETAIWGSYGANAWGLYDMHGNVREWCLDSYGAYSPGAVIDPFVTGGSSRVLRGGSWADQSPACRSAARISASPGSAVFNVGFRIVLGEILVP